MKVTNTCVDLVKAWEGIEDGNPRTVRLDPYMDPVGIWTIGYGEALTDADGKFLRGIRAKQQAYSRYPRGLSMAEAESRLRVKLDDVAERLERNGVHASQHQNDAFTSLCYNIGVGSAVGRKSGFLGSTLLRMHRDGGTILLGELDHADLRVMADKSKERAAPENLGMAFASWSFAGGRWMLGLFRRRISEYLIYRGDALDVALATVRSFHG